MHNLFELGSNLKSENLGNFKIMGELNAEVSKILTPESIIFLSKLHKKFQDNREKLLAKRTEVQKAIDLGEFPCFLGKTEEIRRNNWKVAEIPQDIMDRRVEITGPVDRKMVINALNSEAQIFMADFEDSHSPTWKATIDGQINLMDAVRRTIHYKNPEGKVYSLKNKTAVLFVRPRGWHLIEKHFLIDDQPVSASLFDFGLFFFHNAHELVRRGTGPYFYLPKMENHLEARLWNDIFVFSQKELGIPHGTIRATALIETILAAFEMDEILYELKDHSAGLNCGRWDYIFSFIKKFRNHPNVVFPDRSQVTMDVHFLKSYSELLVQTCHRRGIHAMGGMAAQIPIKNNPEKNQVAMEKVRNDKRREVALGHDGTWVAHPGLVEIARGVFDEGMKGPHQINRLSSDIPISPTDLLTVPVGEVTEGGLRNNIDVALLYLESWLRGVGCVPLYDLMEDAATAEISRSQVWQWIHHGKISKETFYRVFAEEIARIKAEIGVERFAAGKYTLAKDILEQMMVSDEFVEFLTLPAYSHLE